MSRKNEEDLKEDTAFEQNQDDDGTEEIPELDWSMNSRVRCPTLTADFFF